MTTGDVLNQVVHYIDNCYETQINTDLRITPDGSKLLMVLDTNLIIWHLPEMAYWDYKDPSGAWYWYLPDISPDSEIALIVGSTSFDT